MNLWFRVVIQICSLYWYIRSIKGPVEVFNKSFKPVIAWSSILSFEYGANYLLTLSAWKLFHDKIDFLYVLAKSVGATETVFGLVLQV